MLNRVPSGMQHVLQQDNSMYQTDNSMYQTDTSMYQTDTDTATHAVQGVSANTSCFNSLSYKTSDNRRVYGLVHSSKHVEAASLYWDNTAALPKNRLATNT